MNDFATNGAAVAQAIDRLMIAEVYNRYALALDEQDLAMLAEVFADDVKFKCGIPGVPYREGIKANQDRLVERHRQRRFRERHLTTHPVIRTLDEGRAQVSAEVVIISSDDGAAPHIEAMGRYDDVLEKRGGRWVFVERAFVPDT
ncbi:MAG: nuclear transport factor 2 family protein [Rhodospirillales bacterium]|jgi:ketosteroid isomerase-like protein|nr:nuclear transport factor 2 family protein [Rhodospirillales bacterium]